MAGGALVRVSHRRKHILEHVAHIILFFFFIYSYISVAVRLHRSCLFLFSLDRKQSEQKKTEKRASSQVTWLPFGFPAEHTDMHITLPHGTFQRHSTESSMYRHDTWIWERTAKAGQEHGNKGDVSLHCSAPYVLVLLCWAGGCLEKAAISYQKHSRFWSQALKFSSYHRSTVRTFYRGLCKCAVMALLSQAGLNSVVCAYWGPQLGAMKQNICDNIKGRISCFFSGIFSTFSSFFVWCTSGQLHFTLDWRLQYNSRWRLFEFMSAPPTIALNVTLTLSSTEPPQLPLSSHSHKTCLRLDLSVMQNIWPLYSKLLAAKRPHSAFPFSPFDPACLLSDSGVEPVSLCLSG